MTYREETGPGWTLRAGRWQDVLGDVRATGPHLRVCVITDVPYSERTVSGQRSGARRDADGWQDPTAGAIGYRAWGREDVAELAEFAVALDARWAAVFCDHVIYRWLEEDFAASRWMTFQPVPWVKQDAAPRLIGDGPSPQSETLFVARPRGPFVARYRKGWYSTRQDRTGIVTGAKPLDLQRAVVRDYSEPGDLVVETCAGGGTTLLASCAEGRRVVGAEVDPDTFAKAVARLRRGVQPDMFTTQEAP